MSIHKYPVQYFSLRQDELNPEQLNVLLAFEQTIGPISFDTNITGLMMDFNSGVRVQLPAGNWHLRIWDTASGLVGFDGDVTETVIISMEKFYVCWGVEISLDNKIVFEHVLDLNDQEVFFYMEGTPLGDGLALLPYVRIFQRYYNCRAFLQISESFKEIVHEYYPDLCVVSGKPECAYASFCLGAFQQARCLVPEDSRVLPIDYVARSMLQLPENAPRVIFRPTVARKIQEPYVCIGVQASGLSKRWLRPGGWNKLVSYLKRLGYRVLCIDGEKLYENGEYSVEIPQGAEDYTGMMPLMERINLLAYADFFVGLGSGLSWLANFCDVPVVLISGFSLPTGEFDTPYRVTNRLVCHGCYNDVAVEWKGHCAKYKGTEREYECSKQISVEMVKKAIDRLRHDRGLI